MGLASLNSESDRELSPVNERLLKEYEQQCSETSSRASSARPVGRPPKAQKGTSVNARDKAHGRTQLHRAASKGDLERVMALVERGADVTILDNAGVSALHDACLKGNAKVTAFLLSKGAPINARDCEGDYPLLDAAQNDHYEVCQLLLEAGANPTLRNTAGCSALSEAEEGRVKELLRKYSDKFDAPGQNRMKISDIVDAQQSETPHSPQRSARIRASHLSVDGRGARSVDRLGRDQLHNFVLEGEDELTEQWLEIIQETDFQDHEGDTPLHTAARLGNAYVVGLLLDKHAKVDIRNKLGSTALHEACRKVRNREVVSLLLEAGASILTKDGKEQTPLDVAIDTSGQDASETRSLEQALERERQEQRSKEKRRLLKAEQLSRRSSASSCQSPKLECEESMTPRKKRKYTRRQIPDDSEQAESAGISLTLQTTQPLEIVKTVTPAQAPFELPTFLTELKTHGPPRQLDSSVRGEPLPSKQEKKAATEQALLQMGRDLAAAMNKQSELLSQVLAGIQQLVQDK
ncbi:ankyrin repeat-containing domain protein [Protomyces lactucae-debilis]|uniref:Ankyrin repeat-containing domain protein n=1 Tax=Protomyces lactucae-debilis TaxID=2754530 RepID=A0A1Y2FDM8_PROLT|nr:ankyrin repeat-containing domain protein [Protomyces lactucae-debilis]ORY82021.1 ankyrin repeat-containing domain protein [Protomyces lactucae-debilis]